MSTAVIGALRVVLGLDTAQFTSGLTAAQKQLRDTGRSLQTLGGNFAAAGAGLTATITAPLIAAGFAASKAATEAADAMGQVESALTSMGDASGRTKEQLAGLAEGLMRNSLYDDDDILRKVTANLLTFGRISGDSFDRAQRAAVDLATRMQMDLQPATLLVGKALNDPIKGLTAMGRAGIQFTAAQKATIKAMVDAGNVAGAQGIILGELERQFGGAAAAAQRTDPYDKLRDSLNSLSESFGAIVNRYIAPMADGLAGLADRFNAMSPAAQNMVALGAAVAAAAGPILIAVGAVVGAIGTLVTTLGTGGALAGVGLALGGLVPIILPVVAGVAAVVAAFMLFRDDVEPAMKALWATAKTTLGPSLSALFDGVKDAAMAIGEAFQTFVESDAGRALVAFSLTAQRLAGTVLIGVFKALVDTLTLAFRAIADAFRMISALLRGDWSEAWEIWKESTARTLGGLAGIVRDLGRVVIDLMRQMVLGVKDWIVDRFQQMVVDPVRRKIDQVKGFFFGLYDAVVGHSYIPDMVEGVAEWMAKLDAGMVAPARAATSETAQQFEQLRDRVAGIMDGLLSENERAMRQMRKDLADLDALYATGNSGMSRAQYEQVRSGIQARDVQAPDRLNPLGPMADGRDISRQAKEAADRVKEQLNAIDAKMQSAADAFSDRFASGLEAALDGDLRGVLEAIFGDMRSQLRDLGRMLFDAFRGSGGGKGAGFDLGSAIASVFGNLPKFATGGSILPGGSGGTDSQLVAFWKSPHERVDIGAPGFGQGGGGPVHFDLRGAVVTADLLRQMEGLAAASGGAAYQGARQTVPTDMAYTNRYSRGRP